MAYDQLCFVQFMHPGGEHEPGDDGRKRWNHTAHRRVFLRHPGTVRREGHLWTAPLHFWTEWEPEAELVARVPAPVPRGPRSIFRPYFVPKQAYSRYQNTDPFVFGDRFLYTGCQQHTSRGPTALRYLKRGSVVLFGSHLDGEFVLDTVFVVSDWADHSAADWRKVVVPQVPLEYAEITLEPWYAAPKQRGSAASCRLYKGATPEHPVLGMYSYFPAATAADTPSGFARPAIRIGGVITPSLKQGKRLNPQRDPGACTELWREVLRQVEAQGLIPGFRAAMPPRVEADRGTRPDAEPPTEAIC
jgi:hypothetical protein